MTATEQNNDAEKWHRIEARQDELIAQGMDPGRAYAVAWFEDQCKHPTVWVSNPGS